MSATVRAGATPRPGAVFGRMARCLSVSVLTTLLSLVTLAALVGWWGTTSWVANIIATAIGTVPSYVLNRRWVWGRDGSGDVWREVVPFWALSFSGLVLSTAAVAAADAWASSIGLVGPTRTALLLLANVGSFAVLWVGQFLVLDRVLFGRPTRRSGHRPLDRLPVAGGEVGLEGVVDRPPVVRRLRPAELEQSGELLPAAHQLP
ncbi:MAG TPA: GtrA family protein [Acidimicrobiales bacterium]